MATTKMTPLSAAFTIFACTISGGLLALPAVFSSVALVPSILLTVLGALTTLCSLVALASVHEISSTVTSYGKLLRFCCNDASFAEYLMDGIIGLFLTGVMGGTFIVVHDFAKQVSYLHPGPCRLHAADASFSCHGRSSPSHGKLTSSLAVPRCLSCCCPSLQQLARHSPARPRSPSAASASSCLS